MANNVLGAQAHSSTTQQLFSSSCDPKKQACGISKSKYIPGFFKNVNNSIWT